MRAIETPIAHETVPQSFPRPTLAALSCPYHRFVSIGAAGCGRQMEPASSMLAKRGKAWVKGDGGQRGEERGEVLTQAARSLASVEAFSCGPGRLGSARLLRRVLRAVDPGALELRPCCLS
jgi:hypothetical protein